MRRGRVLVPLLLTAGAAVSFAGAVSSASSPAIVTNPTWSPDGSEVAFAYTSSTNYRIVIAPAAGAGPIRTLYLATQDGCCDPMLWSAAGRLLYLNNYSLMSLPIRGGKPTKLVSNVSRFLLSPNSATLAFDGHEQQAPVRIGLVDVRGGKPTLVPGPATTIDSVDGFSPDGTELVFARGSLAGKGGSTLMVEHVRGGKPVPLIRSGLIGASRLAAGGVDVQWSPDGAWIAFVRRGHLDVVSRGTGATRVVAGWLRGGFSWSPNSKLLACLCGADREHLRFTTLEPQGHSTVLWTNPSVHYVTENTVDRPQWSPDGSKLAFLARVGPGDPPIQVWVVGADGTGLKRVA